MAIQTITLTQGITPLLTLFAGANDETQSKGQVTDLSGWDDIPNISISTVPKLFGVGSYVVSKRIEERDLTLEASIEDDDVRTVRDTIAAAAQTLENITVEVSREVNGIIRIESISALITGLEWDQLDDKNASLTLSLKSTSGLKTVDGAQTL